MVELLKKLRDNDVEMGVKNSSFGPYDVVVKFSKHLSHEYYPVRCYEVHIDIEEIDACRLSFEQIVLVHLDKFLFGLGKEAIDISCQNT